MKTYKKIISILAILVLAMIPIKGHAAGTMSDIPAKSKTEIDYLINNKVITGYPDQTFRPNNNVTREEAATMIGRAIGLNGTKRTTSFADVKASSFGSGYIQSAVEAGIITGYEDKTFRPTNKITRGEMAYLLTKAFKLKETSKVSFKDVIMTSNQGIVINQMVTGGLSNGYPDGTFKPTNNISREEFSLMVARGMNEDFRVSSEAKPLGVKYVNATSLNVRKGPDTSYAAIGYLKSGDKVTVYSIANNWAYITNGSLTGYVSATYLSDAPPVVQPPTDPQDPTPPVTGKHVITIDAGHGGKDPGSSGNGLVEKDITLAVSLKVQKKLEAAGIKVVMTRTGDTYPTLQQRINIGVNAKADTFVSIHANKFGSESANGTESYYNTKAALSPRAEASKQLATFIQKRLVKALGTTDRGVKTADYQVITYNPLPAALIELGFLSNKSDASKLGSDNYQNLAAQAIVDGIKDYYNWKDKQ
ncbi:N-acetylmuramoyl-L-alanine amidase [Heyndrickxia oleronia]|nr:N-acetylmuramoyl-L-alanine amidase [Heyndrickxia oleronia]MEC1377420.1 N-acetylmuramoyl-L-alanine amidase [Heyndrickxia oleronia]QQZ05552.1 N-acetylmuramoyl-L-alanine amidase [Heyndrickxia oleronia]